MRNPGSLATPVLAVVVLLNLAAAGALPELPKSDWPLVEGFDRLSNANGQALWQPMSGSAPVSAATTVGRMAFRMPCNFKGKTIERASWDHAFAQDLAAYRGIQFRFFCTNSSPVSHFTFFFRSGKGWYAAPFYPASPTGWETVTIRKSETTIEGTPAGWGKVDAIRISAWRGNDVDTEFYVADFGLLGADASIAIIRAESVAMERRSEARAIDGYCQTMADYLDDLGLPCCLLSDREIAPEHLRGKRIVILPYNSQMPEGAAKTLVEFVRSGGKVISFYVLPSQIAAVVGIEPGRHVSQAREGYFSSLHFGEGVLKGAPPIVGQKSWNISDAKAVEGKSRVAASWFDDQGKPTGHAAVVVSDNGIHMTHVLLSDDPARKRQMLLAMVGHFLPNLWRDAAQKRIEQIGRIGAYRSFDEAAAAIRATAGNDASAQQEIAKAGQTREAALALCAAGKFPEAMAKSNDASSLTVTAYCLAQKPQPGERRIFWCHSAFGVAGMSWDEAIKILADNGFTAIQPNMLWGGVAYYESSVLPVAPEVREKGDQIKACLAACKKYGIECHVWKVNWNMGSRTPKEFLARMRAENRTQAGYDGTPEPRWLCPSNPENQKLEIASMVEVATKYDVNGVHFDYIRYPNSAHCFCGGCRERFEKSLGRTVAPWPGAVRNDPAIREKWNDFRRNNITTVVAAVSEAVRKAKPKVKISAAVFSNWVNDRDGVGQDWKLWCEKGYMDYVCPMDYTPSDTKFENLVALQRTWAGKVPCYPGIGLSVWTPKGDVCKLISQIAVTRRLATGGFTVFNYSETEARAVVPLCGKGITRK